jgi:hypothetical protein
MALIYPADSSDSESSIHFRTVGGTAACLIAHTSASTGTTACLRVMLPALYPEKPAEVLLEHTFQLDACEAVAIVTSAAAICAENAGEAVLYMLADNLTDMLD